MRFRRPARCCRSRLRRPCPCDPRCPPQGDSAASSVPTLRWSSVASSGECRPNNSPGLFVSSSSSSSPPPPAAARMAVAQLMSARRIGRHQPVPHTPASMCMRFACHRCVSSHRTAGFCPCLLLVDASVAAEIASSAPSPSSSSNGRCGSRSRRSNFGFRLRRLLARSVTAALLPEASLLSTDRCSSLSLRPNLLGRLLGLNRCRRAWEVVRLRRCRGGTPGAGSTASRRSSSGRRAVAKPTTSRILPSAIEIEFRCSAAHSESPCSSGV